LIVEKISLVRTHFVASGKTQVFLSETNRINLLAHIFGKFEPCFGFGTALISCSSNNKNLFLYR
jgi:hypothetical protein